MANARRLLIFGVSLFVVAFIGGGTSLPLPARAAPPVQTFTTPVTPPKLHAGDFSHPGLAQATPPTAESDPALNGYCITVQNSGVRADLTAAPDNGFTWVNGPPITPTTPTTNSAVLDTDHFYVNDPTPGSSGDVYCAIVRAGTGITSVVLLWNYTDGATTGKAALVIPVVTITLKGTDGVVGGAATVCTVGWPEDDLTPPTQDAAWSAAVGASTWSSAVGNEVGANFKTVNDFLTGKTSNTPAVIPNPLDQVVAGDWAVTTPGPSIAGNAFKSTDGEWCVNVSNAAPLADITVTFTFHAVYNRQITTDDQEHTLTGTAIIDINAVDYSELRHMTRSGQLIDRQDADENVIGARHTACVIPSEPGDILNPQDINFTSSGPGGSANAVDVFVFNAGANLPGVAAGTVCFSWISTSPGEQFVSLSFTKVVGAVGLGIRWVSWDTNRDGNGGTPVSNTALLKQWNTIDRTEITSGGDPRDLNTPLLTNKSITQQLDLNIANGQFLFSGGSAVTITEWVLGSHTGTTGKMSDLVLDGVVLTATITGSCGHFVSETDATVSLGTTISGVSVAGRFNRLDNAGALIGTAPGDLHVSITGDGCGLSSVIRVSIEASYPGPLGSNANPVFGTEYVDIKFEFTPAAKTPRVAWAGQTVTIDYALAFSGSCGAAGSRLHFVHPKKQPGTFLASPGITINGADHAYTTVGGTCAASVKYESEMPGEVDIEVFLENNQFSKVAFPIFFLAIEDVTTTATSSLVVSSRGNVSSTVRGWFVGNNPSGRPAETKPDGRQVPADRWILPTDWETLRGRADFRPNWPSSPSMPLTDVTFFMENESVINNFKAKIKNGASGWFLLNGTESSLNVNPRTGEPSVWGSVSRPRIITDLTDQGGTATVDTFGDFNLTYEACAANLPTGNPHCKVNDIVGHTRYYAIADYPEQKGQLPPVMSNVSPTDWTWAGYKEINVVDTDSPMMKYVVVHMKDRDGFCDAASFNNVLGIPVDLQIDSGDGKVIGAEGQPATVTSVMRGAVVTSFDTKDDSGNPMNVDITKTVVADDECQAWIKISNSFLTKTNVVVTIPGPPTPIPGDVRVTGLTCSGPETVTVTNKGKNPIALAGLSLRGRATDPLQPEPYLGLEGLLAPGQSKTFDGGPNASAMGWLNTGGLVFPTGGPDDYARLAWNEVEVSRMYCDGRAANPATTPTLPRDPEGDLVLDIVVPFQDALKVDLTAGWNMLAPTRGGSVATAVSGNEANLLAVYSWDASSSTWRRFTTTVPGFVNTIDRFEVGQVYWIQALQPFSLILTK